MLCGDIAYDADLLIHDATFDDSEFERAIDVYAYGEAVRLLEQAIKVQKVLNPEDKGSSIPVLPTTVCAEWNSFLGTGTSSSTEPAAAIGLVSGRGGGLYVSGRAGQVDRPIRRNSGGLDALVVKLYDPFTDGS
jgi:hypothetical protein